MDRSAPHTDASSDPQPPAAGPHAAAPARAAARALALGAVLLAVVALAPRPAAAQEGAGPDRPEALLEKSTITVPEAGKVFKIDDLVKQIGDGLKYTVVIDEALKGKTIQIYNSAELNFYGLVEVFRTYGIELEVKPVPGDTTLLRAVLQRNLGPLEGTSPTRFFEEGQSLPPGAEVVTAVYYFKHIDQSAIQQAQTAVRALMGRDQRRVGNILQVPGTTAIIITDFADQVEFYLRICRAIDQPTPQLDYKIVKVEYALAEELAALVNALTPALDLEGAAAVRAGGAPAAPVAPRGVRGPGGATTPGQPQVVADPRTNKLVILALPEDIVKIERLIRDLDVKVPPAKRHFHVYKCVNASAVQLAEALNALFGANVSFSSQTSGLGGTRGTTGLGGLGARGTTGLGGRSTTGLGARGTQFGNTGLGQTGTFGNQAALQRQGLTGTGTALGGVAGGPTTNLNPGEMGEVQVRIVPDLATNSLLIQALEADYNDILYVLQQLDKKRRRVHIECQVWEIEVTDDFFFAVDTAFTDGADSGESEPNAIRGHGLSSFGLLAPVVNEDGSALGLSPSTNTLGRGGLIFALTQGSFDRVPLLVQALATQSKANLLTMPFATTNDGETAVFSVQNQQPFRTNTANNVANFQSFDFATAESSIQITPRIASGSNLTLELVLNIQSFTAAASEDGAPPPSSGRTYEGIVTVPNREYIVFGGLELTSETEARSRIPILGDIPIIGWLFGRTTQTSVRRRIYVFVRPIIFDDLSDDAHFEDDLKASKYAYSRVVASSLFGGDVEPIIPEQALDARAPSPKAAAYQLFGETWRPLFPEPDEPAEEGARATPAAAPAPAPRTSGGRAR